MIKVIIIRNYQLRQTPGRLLVIKDSEILFTVCTLELPWLLNRKYLSCIPGGTYQVNKVDKPPRGKYFEILNVPGRSGVLIHSGNYASGSNIDTQGCILPGLYFSDINADGHSDVCISTPTLHYLWSILPDDFLLTIC